MNGFSRKMGILKHMSPNDRLKIRKGLQLEEGGRGAAAAEGKRRREGGPIKYELLLGPTIINTVLIVYHEAGKGLSLIHIQMCIRDRHQTLQNIYNNMNILHVHTKGRKLDTLEQLEIYIRFLYGKAIITVCLAEFQITVNPVYAYY